MGLNIVSNGGDFKTWTKYNSKAGRWYIKGDGGEIEVQPKQFIVDFANIKTGWLLFLEGQAPSQVWDESLTQPTPKPSDKHKRGFAVSLFSKSAFNGVVELSSNSMHLCGAINDLYTAYEAGIDSNKGKVPVVEYVGCTPMKDKMGINYRPDLKLVKWVDRPAELNDGEEEVAIAPAPKPAPAAPPASSASEF
jgi:hypothetical protein